jgi:uncharacterized protein (DUF4415 family)
LCLGDSGVDRGVQIHVECESCLTADTSDIPELDDHFWETAKMVTPISKKTVSLRLDSDILDWFKSQGKGYQSMINNILRTYVNHQEKG